MPKKPWPLWQGSASGAGQAAGMGRSGCWHLLRHPFPMPSPAEAPGPHRAPTSLSPQFGESQQLRMVRILRSTLMVRVGGGWIALDEFLVKNDPCRGGCGGPTPGSGAVGSPCLARCLQGLRVSGGAQLTVLPRVSHCWDPITAPSPPPLSPVKGRTNLKINEKYLSSDVFGATAAATRCAGNQSATSSKVLSPSRSNSSLSLYSSASAPSSPLARKVRTAEPPP